MKKFIKILSDDSYLISPNPLITKDGNKCYHPKDSDYLENGFLKLEESPPPPLSSESNKIIFSYEKRGDSVLMIYKEIPNVEYDEELRQLKNEKLFEISNDFRNEIEETGKIIISKEEIPDLEGFVIDARRKDKDNISSMQKLMRKERVGEINYVGFSEIRNISLQQLEEIEILMIKFGNYLYEKKWFIEKRIKDSVSKIELNNIKWESI